ncbi:MAG: heptosyltransferase, partial [Deltaproteobacteria bacterium]|nr:heptosyltransferase [Deltaproteobacteria bacterium]
GVPVVTLFGPSNWREWTVADATHRAVTADRACLGCGRKGCADKGKSLCLEDLAPGTVIRAADEILSNPGPG